MGLFDSLFDTGQPELQTAPLPGAIQRPANFIGNRVNNLLRRPENRGFNPIQQEGFNSLLAGSRTGNPFLDNNIDFLQSQFATGGLNEAEFGLGQALIGGEAINPAASEIARIAYGGELGGNPFLESTFNRAANVLGENFRNNIIPGLDNEFAAAGRSGSRRYAQDRNRAEDAYGRQINDFANELFGGQYNSDLARRDQALAQLSGLGQQDVQNRLTGAGLFQQGRQNVFNTLGQTAAIDAQRFTDPARIFELGNIQQQNPFGLLQTGANIINTVPRPQNFQTPGSPSPLNQLIGLGGQVGAAAAGNPSFFGSDIRLKTDIERVGELPSGLPIYYFRYKDDPPGAGRHLGVMAHEAVFFCPEAVDAAGGVLAVDYARVH